jgi:hypothetical protein
MRRPAFRLFEFDLVHAPTLGHTSQSSILFLCNHYLCWLVDLVRPMLLPRRGFPALFLLRNLWSFRRFIGRLYKCLRMSKLLKGSCC